MTSKVNMTTLSQLASTLRFHFEKLSLTQEALGREAGISRQTLNKALSGSADFRITTLLAVADRLGLDIVLIPKGASKGIDTPLQTQPLIKSKIARVLERLETKDTHER